MRRKPVLPGFRWSALKVALTVVWGAALLTGCATQQQAPYGAIEKVVQERTGQRVQWSGQPQSEEVMAKAVAPLLAQPLAVQSAVRIALVNNRTLLATLQDLGIAQADLVQAGLLANLELGIRPRWPVSGGGGNNTELDLMQDFLDVVALPLRKRVAALQLEQTKSRVAHDALDLVYQVQSAFYTYQGQLQARDMQRMSLAALDAATDLAQRQRRAGNISELALLLQESTFERAKLDLASTELQIEASREQLNRLLGLWGPQSASWNIAGQLPQPPATEESLDHLETQAIQQRMDLAAARRETETLSEALSLQRRTRWTSLFQFGVDYERELDGTKVVGPHLVLGLPIFDRGQARLAAAQARLEQSRKRLDALATDIRAEVREARQRLLAARNTALFYRDVLLPKAQRVLALSQTYYNGMQLGIFDLLKAKQNEITTRREYIEALRDYWIARAKLGSAVGGGLMVEPAARSPVPPSPPASPGAMDMGLMGNMGNTHR